MQRKPRSTSRVKLFALGVAALGMTLSTATGSLAADGNEGQDGQDGYDVRDKTAQRETAPSAPRVADKTPAGKLSRESSDAGAKALSAAIEAYQEAEPSLSRAQATAAAKGQEARKQLWEDILADNVDAFGGAWFDPKANLLHVNLTDTEVAAKVRQEAKEAGLSVRTHQVKHTFEELDALAGDLRDAKVGLGGIAGSRVGLDVRNNRVVAQVAPKQVAEAREEAPGRVRVEPATKQSIEADACTDRNSCPDAVRSGSILWKGSVGNDWCSAGATAVSSTTNRRYVLTAGHCVGASGEYWGTGNRYIGTRWASQNTGDVDVATIWVRYWPFVNQSNGEIWAQWQADRAVDMDSVAPSQSWIWEGDTVCLSANYTDPDAFGNRCGVVGANSDASVRGLTRVDGIDACGGDSGGGWYWLTNSGSRYGYGVHSRSDTGCNGSAGGDQSWFTTLPRVKTWIPSLNYETQ